MITDALIARCARQEPKAQYELYRALYGLMMSICTRYERNHQDAVARMNHGFLKVLNNINARRPDVPFTAWVSRILINTVIDDFRRNKDRKTHEILHVPLEEHGSSEINEYLHHMEADALADLLMQLPPMSRNVFNLFAIDGYAHAEIAEMLGISEGTSKWHVSHARDVLRKALAALAQTNTIRTTAP